VGTAVAALVNRSAQPTPLDKVEQPTLAVAVAAGMVVQVLQGLAVLGL
jgi:hypothetical protein